MFGIIDKTVGEVGIWGVGDTKGRFYMALVIFMGELSMGLRFA